MPLSELRGGSGQGTAGPILGHVSWTPLMDGISPALQPARSGGPSAWGVTCTG